MAMLAISRKRTGRLDIGNALAGWLRANTGPHVHQSVSAAGTVSEAGRLRDFVADPLGTVDEAQDRLLRCRAQHLVCHATTRLFGA